MSKARREGWAQSSAMATRLLHVARLSQARWFRAAKIQWRLEPRAPSRDGAPPPRPPPPPPQGGLQGQLMAGVVARQQADAQRRAHALGGMAARRGGR